MIEKYELQKTGQNIHNESLYSILDLERNTIIKTDLLAKDAHLFIENLTLLEELSDYLGKKTADISRIKDSLSPQHRELLEHTYDHDIARLLLKAERLVGNLRKIDDNDKAENLMKRLEKLNTVKPALPVLQRVKRAFNLIRTL